MGALLSKIERVLNAIERYNTLFLLRVCGAHVWSALSVCMRLLLAFCLQMTIPSGCGLPHQFARGCSKSDGVLVSAVFVFWPAGGHILEALASSLSLVLSFLD